MAGDGVFAKVEGLPDLRAELQGLPAKLKVRALRNALAAGAREVQKAARAATPVISASDPMVRKGYRKPGTVRQAIRVRTSKRDRREGNVGVFVNVRPAAGAKYKTRTATALGGLLKARDRVMVKASQRGAKSPNDPYFWRFIEFGTKTGTRAYGFLQKGADALPRALEVFVKKIGPAIQKLNRPKAPAP